MKNFILSFSVRCLLYTTIQYNFQHEFNTIYSFFLFYKLHYIIIFVAIRTGNVINKQNEKIYSGKHHGAHLVNIFGLSELHEQYFFSLIGEVHRITLVLSNWRRDLMKWGLYSVGQMRSWQIVSERTEIELVRKKILAFKARCRYCKGTFFFYQNDTMIFLRLTCASKRVS